MTGVRPSRAWSAMGSLHVASLDLTLEGRKERVPGPQSGGRVATTAELREHRWQRMGEGQRESRGREGGEAHSA